MLAVKRGPLLQAANGYLRAGLVSTLVVVVVVGGGVVGVVAVQYDDGVMSHPASRTTSAGGKEGWGARRGAEG